MASSSSTGVQTDASSMLPQDGEFETQLSTAMVDISSNGAAVEAAFHTLIDNYPDLLALRFATPLSLPTTPADTRALQAAVLRQLFSRGSALVSRLSPAAKETLKCCLLRALKSAPNSRDIWGAVTDLAARLLPDPGSRWDELMIYLIEAASSQSAALQESALLLLREVNIGNMFDDYSDSVIRLLKQCLRHDTSSDVRIAALGATANVIQCIATSECRVKLQHLLPFMSTAVHDCLNHANEASATASLKLVVILSHTEPGGFLEPQADVLAAEMLQIAEDEQANSSIQAFSVKFLVNVAERAGLLLRLERTRGADLQLPSFLDRLVKVLMRMLLDVGDNPICQIAESWDGGVAPLNGYCRAQLGLHRLAIAFGDEFAPIAVVLLEEYFSATKLEWRKHCAALIALAQIAKGCSKIMLGGLDKMVAIILEEFKHSHPGVQWAAINAISQLSKDLGSSMQQYHNSIFPALVNALECSESPLVQEVAASTIFNFSRICSNPILSQHLAEICTQLNVFGRAKQIGGIELLSSSDSAATPPASPPPLAAAEENDQVVRVAQSSAAKRRFRMRRGFKKKSQELANQQQKMLPIQGNALVAFLKALSAAAVTTTATIIITVATVAWPDEPTTISKMLLTALLYYGLPMTAVASAIAHSSEHYNRWLGTAIGLLMCQVIFTIIVGGGVIAFKHESELVAWTLTLFTLMTFLIAWNLMFKQPKCLRVTLNWIWEHLPPVSSTSESIGGFFLWIKQRFSRTPVTRGAGADAV